MKTVFYSTEINAPAMEVYNTMLDRSGYQQWTKPFSPTSDFKGSWNEGKKIYFSSLDENGKEAGMISEVIKNIPADLVIVRHLGMWNEDGEIFEGPFVDDWRNILEIYRFNESDGKTTVNCSVELSDKEDSHSFDKMWTEALVILKKLCEN